MPTENSLIAVRKTSAKLVALTAVVLLAHVGLLYGTPMALTPQGQSTEVAFSTRMIAPSPAIQPKPVEPPPPHYPVPRISQRSPAPDISNGPEADTAQAFANADNPSEIPTAPPATSDFGVVSQLLNASGPPAYLKPGNQETLLAAADEPRPSMGMSASAGGSTVKPLAANATPLTFAFPPSTHLKYSISGEVKGFPYHVKGDLQWKQDGKTYDARMEVSHFLLGSRVQTSRGDLGVTGLEPIRFGDKVRSEVAAHFDRSKGKVTFSANTADAILVIGMQDHLSALVQLGSMLAGAPANFPEGTSVPLEAVGPRTVESWVFKVGSQEKLALPGGQVNAIKLVREAVGDYGTRGEVWLAPSMGYLPVRIRLIEPNGNFIDQKWSDTVTP